ncbi:MAG: hypothetical protein OEZ22_13715 [Spirochaetia bacterium]|nr:hypothetical protein [Spirochaetia bacterium]
MKIKKRIIFTAVSVLIVGLGLIQFLHSGHSHSHGELFEVTLDNGKKWQTDENTKKNLSQINNAVKDFIGKKDTLQIEDLSSLHENLSISVETTLKECKMESRACEELEKYFSQIIVSINKFKNNDINEAVKALDEIDKHLVSFNDYFF